MLLIKNHVNELILVTSNNMSNLFHHCKVVYKINEAPTPNKRINWLPGVPRVVMHEFLTDGKIKSKQ